MKLSCVIRSKDEADRLRLTLTSLAMQTEKPEVVVVNDGSSDHTPAVIASFAQELDLVTIHHEKPAGRSAAANAGARAASGEIILFLDGDTMAAPDLVAAHLATHRARAHLVVRGEPWHLRCTRPFLDPEKGTPKPGEETKVQRMSESERAKATVTQRQIRESFEDIVRRAQPGIYQGFGPRRLYELETEALRTEPENDILWAAASGHNQSLGRTAFLESGGFHPDISINEHRELVLRLYGTGLRMATAPGRSYHLIHRSGWRDPMEDLQWERIFFAAHPIAEVALLYFFWGGMSDPCPFPAEAIIPSLPELAEVAKRYRGIEGLKNVREAHLRASIGTANQA